MNTKHLLPLLALAGAGAFASLSAAPAPLLLWNFDEGLGSFAVNTGSAGDADLYFLAPGGDPTIGFSVGGKGVSEKPGDHAFDLTTADGMGATTPNSTGPAGVVWSNAYGLTSLSGLSSFTLSGWIKPTAAVNRSARIVASPTITLMAGVENRLSLQVNGATSTTQSEPAYDQVGEWMFFAVTYDGTREIDNVTYYVGFTNESSLKEAGVTTIAAGQLKPFTSQFIIGNNSSNSQATRPFMGLIDAIAIHGSKTGSAGALTRDEIEAVRAAATR